MGGGYRSGEENGESKILFGNFEAWSVSPPPPTRPVGAYLRWTGLPLGAGRILIWCWACLAALPAASYRRASAGALNPGD